MAYVPIINTAQVEIRGSLWGQKVENTLYFSHIGGPIAGIDLQALADEIEDWWSDEARARLCQAYEYREVFATDLTTAFTDTASTSVTTGWLGTYPTDATTMPGNVTICAAFRTAGRGRSSRGRNYWPGMPRNTIVGNTVVPAYMASIQALYRMLLPGGIRPIPGWQWVVASRRTNNADRAVGLVTPVLDIVFADDNVDSMRRRLVGRGD